MGVSSKICPSCKEKNNPTFTRCWKCNGQLENPIPLCNPTIYEMWEKNLLGPDEGKDVSIIFKEDIEEVINLLIADKIDPRSFTSNLTVLLTGGTLPFGLFLEIGEEHKPTKSVSNFSSKLNRPLGTPLWVLAAYPDVVTWFYEELAAPRWFLNTFPDLMAWFRKQQEEHAYDLEADSVLVKFIKLFGMEKMDLDTKENKKANSEGRLLPKHYKNLVRSYKTETGRELEAAVRNLENDVYAVTEMCESIGFESTFTMIAGFVTKYYLELTRSHSDRFSDEVSVLAAAGILDAQAYIAEGQINPIEIINMAKALNGRKEVLIDFIVNLEVLLFKIDTPNMSSDDIKKGCEEQRENIKKVIQKIKKCYVGEPAFAANAINFMQSHQFKSIRDLVGVKAKQR